MEIRIPVEEAEKIIEQYLERQGYRICYFNFDENDEPLGVKFSEGYFNAFIGGKRTQKNKWENGTEK